MGSSSAVGISDIELRRCWNTAQKGYLHPFICEAWRGSKRILIVLFYLSKWSKKPCSVHPAVHLAWKLLQCAWMTGNFCRAREVAIWKAGLFWTTKQQSENKWLIWQHHFDQTILGAGLVLQEHAQRLHGKLQLPGKTIPMSWNSSW